MRAQDPPGVEAGLASSTRIWIVSMTPQEKIIFAAVLSTWCGYLLENPKLDTISDLTARHGQMVISGFAVGQTSYARTVIVHLTGRARLSTSSPTGQTISC